MSSLPLTPENVTAASALITGLATVALAWYTIQLARTTSRTLNLEAAPILIIEALDLLPRDSPLIAAEYHANISPIDNGDGSITMNVGWGSDPRPSQPNGVTELQHMSSSIAVLRIRNVGRPAALEAVIPFSIELAESYDSLVNGNAMTTQVLDLPLPVIPIGDMVVTIMNPLGAYFARLKPGLTAQHSLAGKMKSLDTVWRLSAFNMIYLWPNNEARRQEGWHNLPSLDPPEG